jgi:hypothetical protein
MTYHNLSRRYLRRFLERVEDTVTEDVLRMPESIIEMVATRPPGILLKGRALTGQDYTISRVVSGLTLRRNIDTLRLGLPKKPLTEEVIRKYAHDGKLKGSVLQGKLRGRLPLCWVTKTTFLEQLRTLFPATEYVDQVQNKLGLRYGAREPAYLFEIRYPPDTFGRRLLLRTPTFLEAGANALFRPCKTIDGWGMTVSLESRLTGGPEAVHKETRIDGHGFEIVLVGRRNLPDTAYGETAEREIFRDLLRTSKKLHATIRSR